MSLNGKNGCQASWMTRGTPNFHVMCDELYLEGKTTAMSECPYYALEIFKI